MCEIERKIRKLGTVKIKGACKIILNVLNDTPPKKTMLYAYLKL